MESINISTIIEFAWKKFNKRPGLCVGTMAIYLGFAFSAGLFEVVFSNIIGIIIPKIISFLITAFASFGATLIALDLIYDRETNIKRFGDVFEYYPKALGQYLLNIIVLFVGYGLLIIPGIIFHLGFLMAPYLILEKKMNIIESFKMSWAITNGHKWKLFLISILFILINGMGAIFLIIGLFITIPLTTLGMIEIFKRLFNNYQKQINNQIASGENPCQI